jgi:hypothetical protein
MSTCNIADPASSMSCKFHSWIANYQITIKWFKCCCYLQCTFHCLVHVLSSFLGHPFFALYKDDCTTRGVSNCGLAIYI